MEFQNWMRELWLSLLKVTNILTNVLFLFTKNACIHSLFNSWLPVAILDCIYCQIKDMHGILPERHVVTFFSLPLSIFIAYAQGQAAANCTFDCTRCTNRKCSYFPGEWISAIFNWQFWKYESAFRVTAWLDKYRMISVYKGTQQLFKRQLPPFPTDNRCLSQ